MHDNACHKSTFRKRRILCQHFSPYEIVRREAFSRCSALVSITQSLAARSLWRSAQRGYTNISVVGCTPRLTTHAGCRNFPIAWLQLQPCFSIDQSINHAIAIMNSVSMIEMMIRLLSAQIHLSRNVLSSLYLPIIHSNPGYRSKLST